MFLAGNAVGSATPTPGGLGGVEAVQPEDAGLDVVLGVAFLTELPGGHATNEDLTGLCAVAEGPDATARQTFIVSDASAVAEMPSATASPQRSSRRERGRRRRMFTTEAPCTRGP